MVSSSRQYNPYAKKIDFVVTDFKNVIHYLKNSNFHKDTIGFFYCPIVKIIYNLPFDESDVAKAYNNYKKLLDSLPEHNILF